MISMCLCACGVHLLVLALWYCCEWWFILSLKNNTLTNRRQQFFAFGTWFCYILKISITIEPLVEYLLHRNWNHHTIFRIIEQLQSICLQFLVDFSKSNKKSSRKWIKSEVQSNQIKATYIDLFCSQNNVFLFPENWSLKHMNTLCQLLKQKHIMIWFTQNMIPLLWKRIQKQWGDLNFYHLKIFFRKFNFNK